jgi:hypothetical protein
MFVFTVFVSSIYGFCLCFHGWGLGEQKGGAVGLKMLAFVVFFVIWNYSPVSTVAVTFLVQFIPKYLDVQMGRSGSGGNVQNMKTRNKQKKHQEYLGATYRELGLTGG